MITGNLRANIISSDESHIKGVELYSGEPQSITGPGAIDVVSSVTYLSTTGADAYTLADGRQGQRKYIVIISYVGNAVITPDNFADGTTITFAVVDKSIDLIFLNNKWFRMGGTGAVA